jgi:hypothetical protein
MTTTDTNPTDGQLRFWDGKSHYWRNIWDHSDGYASYHNVGVNRDGSLHNPNGYPEDRLRASIDRVFQHRRQRRSDGAKKAAATRARRKEQLLYRVVQRLKDGGTFTAADNCEICGRMLDDPQSLARGIGSECWQRVLTALERSASPPLGAYTQD